MTRTRWKKRVSVRSCFLSPWRDAINDKFLALVGIRNLLRRTRNVADDRTELIITEICLSIFDRKLDHYGTFEFREGTFFFPYR